MLVNNWEATYFDFDEDRILDIASRAKDIGAELVVLDDGWFGHRDDDTTSLGDWDADRRKLPGGIVSLSSRIHDMGLEFGLWFEPEMINMDSDLHRTHPEWMVGPPNRGLTPQRNQYVLDMARPEVVDHLATRMSRLISAAHIDYIKWDMNRNITEAYSAALDDGRQGEFFHRYIMGVYALYDRLTHEHPDVLFESCASGGGRFDLGMMYYAPQAWLSDDTDAVERALIQYATSYGYPQSTMGAHVSAVPNHETGRVTPLSTRGDVAFFGDLGYELDISTASAQDLSEMRRQISFYVSHRDVFQRGVLTRLVSPYEGDGNLMAWQVASHGREHGDRRVSEDPQPSQSAHLPDSSPWSRLRGPVRRESFRLGCEARGSGRGFIVRDLLWRRAHEPGHPHAAGGGSGQRTQGRGFHVAARAHRAMPRGRGSGLGFGFGTDSGVAVVVTASSWCCGRRRVVLRT